MSDYLIICEFNELIKKEKGTRTYKKLQKYAAFENYRSNCLIQDFIISLIVHTYAGFPVSSAQRFYPAEAFR